MSIDSTKGEGSSEITFNNWKIESDKDKKGGQLVSVHAKIGNNTFKITANLNPAMVEALSHKGKESFKTIKKVLENSSEPLKKLVEEYEKNNQDQPTMVTMKVKPFASTGSIDYHTLPTKTQSELVSNPTTEETAKSLSRTKDEKDAANTLTIQINKMFNEVVGIGIQKEKPVDKKSISESSNSTFNTTHETKKTKRKETPVVDIEKSKVKKYKKHDEVKEKKIERPHLSGERDITQSL